MARSIFDRSSYNRAGVERVMGFATKKETHVRSLKTDQTMVKD